MFSIKIILTCYGLTKHYLKNPCAGKFFVNCICLELKRNLPVFMLIKNETNLVFMWWKSQVFLLLLAFFFFFFFFAICQEWVELIKITKKILNNGLWLYDKSLRYFPIFARCRSFLQFKKFWKKGLFLLNKELACGPNLLLFVQSH